MQYSDQLNNAVTVTKQMLDAAKDESWERVIQLEEERQLILKAMERAVPQIADSDVANNLKVLIALNDELTDLSALEKAACFSQFSKNKNHKKAFQTYGGY